MLETNILVSAHLAEGAGIAVVGCCATLAEAEIKLNVWPDAHICTTGIQTQSLASLDASTLRIQSLTATFTPRNDVFASMEEFAHPTCVAAPADAVVDHPVTTQMNRCILDAALQEDLLFTQRSNLFTESCRLRDRTGGMDVDILGSAVPSLHGCSDAETMKAQLVAQFLTSATVRLNKRGVLLVEFGVFRKCMAKIGPRPLQAVAYITAMRLSLGLFSLADDAVRAALAVRLLDAPLLFLEARRASGAPLGAHSVLLLVECTVKTDCDSIDDTLPLAQRTFKVISPIARCLLSDPATHVTLAWQCDCQRMMQYLSDKKRALVLVSHHVCGARLCHRCCGARSPLRSNCREHAEGVQGRRGRPHSQHDRRMEVGIKLRQKTCASRSTGVRTTRRIGHPSSANRGASFAERPAAARLCQRVAQ